MKSPVVPTYRSRVVACAAVCAGVALVCVAVARSIVLAVDPSAFSPEESEGLQFGLGGIFLLADLASLALQITVCTLMRIGILPAIAVIGLVFLVELLLAPILLALGT